MHWVAAELNNSQNLILKWYSHVETCFFRMTVAIEVIEQEAGLMSRRVKLFSKIVILRTSITAL